MRQVELTLPSILDVVGRMRPQDRQCVAAALGSVTDEEFAVNRFQAFSSLAGWALVDDAGTPWAIGGIAQPNRWTGHLWLVVADGMPLQSWRKLARITRTLIAEAIEPSSQLGIHRIEAQVLSSWSEAQHFVRRVGMHLEGTLRSSGCGGEDIQVWSVVGPAKGD